MVQQGNSTSLQTTPRSRATVAFDNVLRRTLRVSNPDDPAQLAKALLERYRGEAAGLEREARGEPVVRVPVAIVEDVSADTAGRAEVRQATDDLYRDLDALIQESQLKDIQGELRGWSETIRAAAMRGIASARQALDPTERDRAFAARRSMSDFARLARYLAALTGCVPGLFCRLAQSCDIMGNLTLVLAGEALAAAGVTRTSVILQTPASDLQVRRETVLSALRNLTGSVQQAHGPNDWPRGITALRQLHQALEQNGATDLRAFLDEGYLGGLFDELIALAANQTSDGLQMLGGSSPVLISQLERFVRIAARITVPASPPLSAFLQAILLFIQSFGASRSGYRLVYVARPPLLFYGLYGIGGTDGPTDRLLDLIKRRGRLAELVDCLCCECSCKAAKALTILGKVLYDVDQAIDLLVQGTETSGAGDIDVRAAAFGALIYCALQQEPIKWLAEEECATYENLTDELEKIMATLQWPNIINDVSGHQK